MPARVVFETVLVLLALLVAEPLAAATISLRADPWCPFNCRPESERPGYLIELARAVFEPLGHRIDYRNLGWKRAIEAARTGAIDGIVGAGIDDAPDLLFPDEPAGISAPVIAVRRGEAFAFTGPDALEGRVVGANLGYEFGGPVDAYLRLHARDPRRVQWVSGLNGAAQNLRKLLAGRIDGVFDDRAVIAYTARELGLAGHIETVETGDRQAVGLAFSPVLPHSALYARQFAEGLRRLRGSGELAAILARYGVPDWLPAGQVRP